MMDAVISGSAHVALVVDGGRLWSIDPKSAGAERFPREPHEIRYLFGDARDLTFLQNVDEAAIREELDVAHAGVHGLHLALMLCDPETSDEAVDLAVGELDGLLARPPVTQRVEHILDAKVMPAAFDLGNAAARCRKRGRSRAAEFFDALADRQPTIQEVRRAWDMLPISLFGSAEDRMAADGTLAREGLFRSLVQARRANASIDGWLAEARRSPAVERIHGEQWLAAWVEPFRVPSFISRLRSWFLPFAAAVATLVPVTRSRLWMTSFAATAVIIALVLFSRLPPKGPHKLDLTYVPVLPDGPLAGVQNLQPGETLRICPSLTELKQQVMNRAQRLRVSVTWPPEGRVAFDIDGGSVIEFDVDTGPSRARVRIDPPQAAGGPCRPRVQLLVTSGYQVEVENLQIIIRALLDASQS